MANEWRAETEISLGGKIRRLRFDFNRIAEMEKSLGAPVTRSFSAENMGIWQIIAGLTAGIHYYEKNVTEEQVGAWMEPSDLTKYGTALATAVAGFFDPEAAQRDWEATNAGKTVEAETQPEPEVVPVAKPLPVSATA